MHALPGSMSRQLLMKHGVAINAKGMIFTKPVTCQGIAAINEYRFHWHAAACGPPASRCSNMEIPPGPVVTVRPDFLPGECSIIATPVFYSRSIPDNAGSVPDE